MFSQGRFSIFILLIFSGCVTKNENDSSTLKFQLNHFNKYDTLNLEIANNKIYLLQFSGSSLHYVEGNCNGIDEDELLFVPTEEFEFFLSKKRKRTTSFNLYVDSKSDLTHTRKFEMVIDNNKIDLHSFPLDLTNLKKNLNLSIHLKFNQEDKQVHFLPFAPKLSDLDFRNTIKADSLLFNKVTKNLILFKNGCKQHVYKF